MVQITVNGINYPLAENTDPLTPILWVLREQLDGLTGTKFGCGMAQCGVCTIHKVARQASSDRSFAVTAVRACVTPLKDFLPVDQNPSSGFDIITIESAKSASSAGVQTELNRILIQLQQAWMQERVPQCGYCQSGQIMSAAALIYCKTRLSDQALSDADIDLALAGNLCRCGTYNRIRRAIWNVASLNKIRSMAQNFATKGP